MTGGLEDASAAELDALQQAKCHSGQLLQAQGRVAEAATIYEEILAADGAHFEALHGLGVILLQAGSELAAIELLSRAIAAQPQAAQPHSNLGYAFQRLKRLEEALASYDRAIALKPDYARAHFNRGHVLQDMGRLEDALASFSRAAQHNPDYVQAHFHRAITLMDLGRFAEAMESFDRTLTLQPGHALAQYNRANVLCQLERDGEALAAYDDAIALAPMDARIHARRSIVLRRMRRFEEAIASCDRAIALQSDLAEAYASKGMAQLAIGRLAPGWKNFEWRRLMKSSTERKLAQPPLTSLADARGKTVLVHCDDGFGDAIQFCRYLPLLREAGARVLFAPQKKLGRLMRSLVTGSAGAITFAGEGDAFDYHIPVVSLPMLFQTTLETIPASVPYLFADATRIEKWRNRIGGDGFKIGICWQGNSAHATVDGRCCALADFAPLARMAGVRLISLHKGTGEAQLKTLPDGMTVEHFDDLDSGPDAFADTAAVMQCMDLVITIDTSVVHLAGALGVRTWALLQQAAEWRWLLDRSDSPWYPRMRLFRQKTNGDWVSLFEDVEAALAGLLKETVS